MDSNARNQTEVQSYILDKERFSCLTTGVVYAVVNAINLERERHVYGGDKDSIMALELERRKIATQLESGVALDHEGTQFLERHETIDWLIAKTQARNLKELQIKFDRLLEATAFDAQATLEGAILRGLKEDLKRMTGRL